MYEKNLHILLRRGEELLCLMDTIFNIQQQQQQHQTNEKQQQQ